MAAYCVYENWTVKKARIHFGSCPYCNNCKGTHQDAGSKNGQWHGPFDTFQEAHKAAKETGQPVSRCKVCRPE